MEKKVMKKATTKKSSVAAKEIEIESAEVIVATSPVKKRASRTADVAVAPVKKRASTNVVAKTVTAKEKSPKRAAVKTKKATLDVTAELAAAEPKIKLSPAFEALADPKLPELKRENRARLLMQSPGRIYFYWSLRDNPYQLLHRAFGDETGSYTLAIKLLDLKRGSEEIHAVDPEGNWWFTVEPDSKYQAEVGFYAPNRPYFRIVFSNTISTPRKNPSPRAATEAEWTVKADKFAEVLNIAGFTQDAFDVAIAGDDHIAAENTTHTAFARFLGEGDYSLHGIAAEDIRYAMMMLASGATLEDLRWKISPALFAILQANADRLKAANAMSALTEHFDIDEAEWTEEQIGPTVYGASLVNFPRTLKTRKISSKFGPQGYSPVSSRVYR